MMSSNMTMDMTGLMYYTIGYKELEDRSLAGQEGY